MDEVRELAHGILPAVLTRGGLRAGIAALGSRTPVPVAIDVSVDRLPAPVEATAYFVVAEALTNVAKHAGAASAAVAAGIEDGTLRVEVRDDGVGGPGRTAAASKGSGTGSPRSTGASGSRAPPTAGRWSRRPSPSRQALSSDRRQ
jgi:signal transduction histidine kinase